MIILLHSSKTMRSLAPKEPLSTPTLIEKTKQLDVLLKQLDVALVESAMQLSHALALKTHALLQQWSAKPSLQSAALDGFRGDIYSGLQTDTFSASDRQYAHKVLKIISGLYGVIRPLDGIYPYRLEMAYKIPDLPDKNLYEFWGDSIAKSIGHDDLIINLASVEYSKAVLPYMKPAQVIAPKFMTIDPATKEPKFVVVHAKIARGAFARWLIQKRITTAADVLSFSDLNYRYNARLSTPEEPVFVAKEFGGLGLSVRLT